MEQAKEVEVGWRALQRRSKMGVGRLRAGVGRITLQANDGLGAFENGL